MVCCSTPTNHAVADNNNGWQYLGSPEPGVNVYDKRTPSSHIYVIVGGINGKTVSIAN